ncbi:right-handed parallel beta-helix repeat-containing protein [Rhizobium laguerreae]|uniref:right-handed parallel beta-helix repeat-containing protein n=1 Tax=Rhizobium laguerreae TaxID=1076926 RepID=UPI001C917316|nr:right-handed parallel beta-helix repeat-containing protein [Rhizobium laguerreae]MBY3352781.1 right-handed parallel beta-helix repeat-containing protein [Rhizobium laguerreae]MBY3451773.1 right-handed parallel beta-helix repeat-containing protein [Rhizobium laguerreae]MBY3458941.1 right-handed parallel beta-helix repeat-containing protein [Rhizobium laguerreae]
MNKTHGHAVVRSASGVYLSKGRHKPPIVVDGKSGTQDEPFVIRGHKSVVSIDITFEDFKTPANELAAAHQAGGSFPGVYVISDNAALIVRNCQWVVIEDLVFENCWPTAIYLDNCQHVTIRRVSFRGGTFAIGAYGATTRHILVEKCDWVQDTSGSGHLDVASIRKHKRIRQGPPAGELWNTISWKAIHGSGSDGLVDAENDARALDGDFFRAWTIIGYVIIRNNVIVDAFNGVHFFNEAAESIKDTFCRNVLIENNWFVRVRDNAVEPEDFAWNWTIRHNNFIDCYMPFSFEMARSGYFYVYGNVGWNRLVPGPDGDTHSSGQLFKFPARHAADGPHYVFNNTWQLRWPIVKKFTFSNLVHANNLIGYARDVPTFNVEAASPFGKAWDTMKYPSARWDERLKFEEKCFTRSWYQQNISFDADLVDHPHFPDIVRAAGYGVGPRSRNGQVNFHDAISGSPGGLRIESPPAAVPMALELPNGDVTDVATSVVGAWQGKKRLSVKGPAFADVWPGH